MSWFGFRDRIDAGTLNLGHLYLSGISETFNTGLSTHKYITVASEELLRLALSGSDLMGLSSGLYFGVGSQLNISLVNLMLWSVLKSNLLSWILTSFFKEVSFLMGFAM